MGRCPSSCNWSLGGWSLEMVRNSAKPICSIEYLSDGWVRSRQPAIQPISSDWNASFRIEAVQSCSWKSHQFYNSSLILLVQLDITLLKPLKLWALRLKLLRFACALCKPEDVVWNHLSEKPSIAELFPDPLVSPSPKGASSLTKKCIEPHIERTFKAEPIAK